MKSDVVETIEESESAIEIAGETGAPKIGLTGAARNDTGGISPPGLGRLVGEMVVRFYEDDGLDVQFPMLGLVTVGRLEKALPLMYNRLHLARQMDARKRDGQPEHFSIHESDN